jgi:hypothetical protein
MNEGIHPHAGFLLVPSEPGPPGEHIYAGFKLVAPEPESSPPETGAPAPTVTGLSPNTAIAGSAGLDVILSGTDFQDGAVAFWDASLDLATTFTDPTRLSAVVTSDLIPVEWQHSIAVRNPDGQLSDMQTFTVTATR